jgi:hypothetical protein
MGSTKKKVSRHLQTHLGWANGQTGEKRSNKKLFAYFNVFRVHWSHSHFCKVPLENLVYVAKYSSLPMRPGFHILKRLCFFCFSFFLFLVTSARHHGKK